MDTIVTPVTVITLDSTRIVHSINADLVARYFPPVVKLVQYDQSLPVIAVSLMQNGQTYTLPSGAAANIRVHKPDATYVYNPALGCDSTRKIVYFEVTQAMAAANGDGLAIVEIVVDGDIAGTSLITLHFEENPVPEDAIESSDEWETIYELGERIIASTVTPVSTAAGMTDHNVVYLYTGTESGWNQGHMYYYNGTTWVDAGIAVTDTTLSVAGLAADAKTTGDRITALEESDEAQDTDISDLKDGFDDLDDRVTALEEGGTGSGLTEDIKQALLQIASKVAYIDEDGQDYYDDLYDALYPPVPPADLVSISAVYTQSGTVYDTDTLDSLKTDLVVTATYSDQTTETVTTYTLSGTLTAGTSTITVTFGGKTDTFTVTVAEGTLYPLTNGEHTFTHSDTVDRTVTVTNKNHVKYTNPHATTTTQGNYGTYAIFDVVTANDTNANTNNINAPSATLFTLPSGASVEMVISNIQYDGLEGSSSSTKYAIALRSGSTSVVTTGDLTPTDTSKTVTKTMTSASNITCGFFYAGIAVKSLEFDISLTVNGERWI